MSLHETPHPTAAPAAGRRGGRPLGRLSAANHVGLVLVTLLALVDVLAVPFLDAPDAPGQNGPPAEVLWFGVATGLVTLAAVALAWAGRWRRPAVRLAAVSRVLSAVTSLPAFFVGGVPTVLVLSAAASVLLTLLAVALVLLRGRRTDPAPA